MKKTILAVAAVLASTAGSSMASGAGEWGYTGTGAPENWGTLDAAYAMCSKGVNQSPINLTGFIEAELNPITFNYTGLVTEVLHNGHAIQANYTAGSTMTAAGKIFGLKQFHFHAPSENQINGEYFPMEAHFVHADSSGSLAVIAVMYSLGEENSALKKIWGQMPPEAGKKESMASQVKAELLLPENKEYYRFNGSLTTPPCTEGVLWMVMKNPVAVSKEQVKQLAAALGHPNNRPIQPTNARPVLQ
ncbi:MAG: carbonic anhydrase family protein [Candidatus Electrothrix sp. AR4]|nr:carbonic anhydrase family protein [Candidatus Electrothrix sp. AR4]